MTRPRDQIKVLLAKPGLDGHDRGVKVVALGLREAGFSVSYTGLRQGVEAIVQRAIDEQADVIGLSILSGSHLPICERMKAAIAAADLGDTLWLVGGNIPEGDKAALLDLGVAAVFPFGTPIPDIVHFIEEVVA